MFRIGSDCWDSVVSSGGNEMISSSETRSATVISVQSRYSREYHKHSGNMYNMYNSYNYCYQLVYTVTWFLITVYMSISQVLFFFSMMRPLEQVWKDLYYSVCMALFIVGVLSTEQTTGIFLSTYNLIGTILIEKTTSLLQC